MLCMLCMIKLMQCAMVAMHLCTYDIIGLQCAVCNKQCIVCTVHCAVFAVHARWGCAVCEIQCAVFAMHAVMTPLGCIPDTLTTLLCRPVSS